MYNPFALFTRPLLDAFIKAGQRYFVRQTYPRGKAPLEEGVNGYFVFSHYKDIAFANYHMSAINHDAAKFLYDWDNPEHKEKLLIAAGKPSGYKIYSILLEKDWQKTSTLLLKDKVKKYIDYNLGWRPGRNETVDFQLFVNYGELFAKLKLRTQEVRVKLEVIEKL
jgi:hypothetical protein